MNREQVPEVRGQDSGGRVRGKTAALLAGLVLLAPDPWTKARAYAQSWSEIAVPSKREETPEQVETGGKLYARHCAQCHGYEGAGDGQAAEYLDPKPRNFTSCTFKLRTTKSGELPTDDDLFRSISHGLNASSMPAWKDRLKPDQMWSLVAFVKTFCPDFGDEMMDPAKQVVPYGKEPGSSKALLEKGKQLYEEQKCWECHARNGKGHGEKAFELTDDWGQAILPRNLATQWQFRGGDAVQDIFLRFTTGINGTPMPSYDTLSEEDRWALAHYVQSLSSNPSLEKVILEMEAAESVPDDLWDASWDEQAPVNILLSGQVIVRPRWQNPAVDLVRLRGTYTADRVAFLLEWDDRTESRKNDPPPDFASYPDAQWKPFAVESRYNQNYSDTVSLQFPVKLPDGPEKPHLFWGSPSKSVDIWEWTAAREGQGPAVTEYTGQGYRKPLTAKPVAAVRAKSAWKDGVWRVLLTRSIKTENAAGDARSLSQFRSSSPERNGGGDVQFQPGKMIPLAVQVRDGSSGEVGPILALSSWYGFVMKTAVPKKVFAYTFLSIGLMLVAEAILVRRVKKKPQGRK